MRLIIPSRDFLDGVGLILNYVPNTFNFNEEVFIWYAIDITFNGNLFDVPRIRDSCFNFANEVSDFDKELVLDIIDYRFTVLIDMMKRKADYYANIIPPYSRAEFMGVNWLNDYITVRLK